MVLLRVGMGDHGASGVVGGFVIIVIFGLAAILSFAFVFTIAVRRGRLGVFGIFIGILLLPFLIIVGQITYAIIKADIEVRFHQQQDKQRKLQEQHAMSH